MRPSPWWCFFNILAGAAANQVAWNTGVLANEVTGPWRFKERDPFVEGWRRDPNDEKVMALKEQLQQNNCMDDLVTFSVLDPDYNVTAAASFFDKHGFVVLEDVLQQPLLENLKNASTYIMERIFEEDPEGSFGGGAGKLPHRYSLGDASATKSNFHLDGYAAVIDLPTTSPLLREIFGSNDYFAAGCGGDVVLAGAMEYQSLHPDAIWGILDGHVADQKLPPAVTINFVLEELTALNGAMRLVPGSHRWKQRPPNLLEEPDWMHFNTLCPIPAGAAIFRDNRCWHGGTPNLSDKMRALPNMEYFPPTAMPSLGWLDRYTMPFETWLQLSPFGQHISRAVVAGPGEEIPGLGVYSPAAILDIMPFLR
eukprot:symbB.v1.2.036802.t2/scaffold5280.1/size28982/2